MELRRHPSTCIAMTLLPISTVRTSTPLATQRLLFQLNADQLALQRQYDQLSTGRRVLRLSDDPAAAGRALGIYRGIDRGNQLVRNAESTNSFYQSADSALSRVDTALIDSRAIAVQAAQTVLGEDERAGLSFAIQESIGSILAAGNSMYRDHQILGGFLNSGVAYEYDGNDILYRGTQAVGRTPLGLGAASPINVTGSQALGTNDTMLVGQKLNATIDSNTRLVDLKQGKGVTPGVIQLSGGSNWVDLDLSSAATLGDVAELLSGVELNGRRVSASLSNEGIRVEYADGFSGTLAIRDTAGSQTAIGLAISNPSGFDAPPLIGDSLSPRVTAATKLGSLNAGAGVDLTAGIRITQNGQDFEIDFAGAETLGDIMIAINRSEADVHAELDRFDGRIVLRALRSGVDYAIGENGGSTATDLGIRSATTETRISQLGRGRGITLNPDGPDLLIDRPDGTVLEIELEGSETIADVIDRIRNHPMNQDTLRVLVRLNSQGNGLQLQAPPGENPLGVRQSGISDAGIRLGLIPEGSQQSTGGIDGAADTIVGSDYAIREAGGSLDTLLRLQRAVADGDITEIERLQARLDEDLDRASRSRGRIGVWTNHLQQLQTVTEDKVTRLQAQLSNEIDADLATVISDMSQRQVALEASMRIIGQTAQLTVLNFL